MPKSERSKFVTVQTAWINYQEKYLGVPEGKLQTVPPAQFADIFWIGYDYARGEASR